MSTSTYRQKEIDKLIEQAFTQFKISDPGERLEISRDILSQLDPSGPVTTVLNNSSASSATYRTNVRNALIDIIAQLLHTKDLFNKLDQLENRSRQIVQAATNNILLLESKLLHVNSQIRETFEEGVDSGSTVNCIIKDGKLRLDNEENKEFIEKIEYTILPTDSTFNNTVNTVTGKAEYLLKTGVGSDSLRIKTKSGILPSLYIGQSLVRGVAVKLSVDTANILLNEVSVKLGNLGRIQTIEGYNEVTGLWERFDEADATLSQHSVVFLPNNTTLYSKYNIYILFPQFKTTNNMYEFDNIIYNLKLYSKADSSIIRSGLFTSHKYILDKTVFKTIFDAKYEGFINFTLEYAKRPGLKFSLLPEDSTIHKYVYKVPAASNDTLSIPLPFPGKESGNLLIKDEGGETINGTFQSNNILSIPSPGDAVLFFIEYEVDRDTSATMITNFNEALLRTPIVTSDRHDKMDGFAIALSYKPWKIHGVDTFTLKSGENEIAAEEIAVINGSITAFDPNKQQYYLFNNTLFTNFDLNADEDVSVEYNIMSAGVTLIAELYNDATIDEYSLELIDADEVYTSTLNSESAPANGGGGNTNAG